MESHKVDAAYMSAETVRVDPSIDAEFVRQTLETLAFLEGQSDLSPRNEQLNSMLSDFVHAVLNISKHDRSAQLLKDQSIQKARPEILKKLSQAEFEMEQYFAEYFTNIGNLDVSDLDDFWYRDCYVNLVAEEVKALNTIGADIDESSQIVFVGSGPLPMTAIDMHLQTGAKIVCVEMDKGAADISRLMIQKLGLADVIDVVNQAGEDFDYTGSQIVFVASLIPQKDQVIKKIMTNAGDALVGVRSVEAMKAMLYEPVGEHDFDLDGLTYKGRSVDTDETINTTLFFERAGIHHAYDNQRLAANVNEQDAGNASGGSQRLEIS